MTFPATLLEATRRLPACPPDMGVHLFGTERSEFLPYCALQERGKDVAHALRARGVGRGDTVIVALPSSVELLVHLCGVIQAGAVIVCVDPGMLVGRGDHRRRLVAQARHVGARVLLARGTLVGALSAHEMPAECALWAVDEHPAGPADGALAVEVEPDDLAVLQFTSGSTSAPKAVRITHGNVMNNASNLAGRFRPGPDDVMVSWLPLFHDMGLNAFLGSMSYPGPFVLIPTSRFIYRPETWLKAITVHRGTISPAPNFAYARCLDLPAHRTAGIDLRSWRVALNGAERVCPATLEGFTARFQSAGFHPTAWSAVYGLAEATLAVTVPDAGTGYRFDPAPPTRVFGAAGLGCVGVGQPFADHALRVVDEARRTLPDRHVGEILVRGPSISRGYHGDATASERFIVDGWLHTGDLGYLDAGELYVVGRRSGKIVVRGHNYHAEELEALIEREACVRPSGALAFGVVRGATDDVVVAAELRHASMLECSDAVADRIRATLARDAGLVPWDVIILAPGSFERTSSGKKRREAFRDAYLAQQIA